MWPGLRSFVYINFGKATEWGKPNKKKHEKGEKNVTLYNLTVNKNTKKLFKATKFTPKRNENPQKN